MTDPISDLIATKKRIDKLRRQLEAETKHLLRLIEQEQPGPTRLAILLEMQSSRSAADLITKARTGKYPQRKRTSSPR